MEMSSGEAAGRSSGFSPYRTLKNSRVDPVVFTANSPVDGNDAHVSNFYERRPQRQSPIAPLSSRNCASSIGWFGSWPARGTGTNSLSGAWMNSK